MAKKVLLAAIAVFIAWEALDFLIHGVILGPSYLATASLWRPQAEMKLDVMMVATFIGALAFAALYGFYVRPKSLAIGAGFGLIWGIGAGVAMGYGTYSAMPIPYSMALTWFLGISPDLVVAQSVSQPPPTAASPSAPGSRPAPLVIQNRQIVLFRVPFVGYSPLERAEGAAQRIMRVVEKGQGGKVGVRTTAEGNLVTIGYNAPWRQVHAMLIRAADRTPGLRKEPKPFVLQSALADFYVEYQLNAHLERPEERIPTLAALHANIQDAFNEYGVQILSPHYLADPPEKVWVPKAQWYAEPAKPPQDPPGAATS